MRLPRTRVRALHLGEIRRGLFRRLNTRLVLAIAAVALIGLLVSAIAINQILPGYFRQQAEERLETAALSLALLIEGLADAAREDQPNYLVAEELRNRFIYGRAATLMAGPIIQATVEIYNESGQLAARVEPRNPAALLEQGLRLDPAVPAYQTPVLPLTIDEQTTVGFRVVLRDAYTTRETTLAQIRSAIFGAGLLALGAALLTGVLAARGLTGPISRLRQVARRVAHGELDERWTASGVVEIDELGAQFNVTADRLAESLRMLEADRDRLREFVADVSHELRTPIAALRTFTELQGDGEVDEATRREFLERSRQQISRLEWLSTNLLDLSRIDAGIFPLDMRPGDLRDPLRSVVEANAELAEERGIGLTSEVPGAPVELRFDYERMVQLVSNLVTNAIKFAPPGGQVSLRLRDATEQATIEVRDTGPGIPGDELPRIFDRFYRGTNTGEARASGSGLGLAIARSIVEMHGGRIEVASVVGEGSVFTIELPKIGPPAAPSVPEGWIKGS